jgi:phytoene dehydrogenase-like protein
VLIVGAGFSGQSAACRQKLAQPSLEVRVLDEAAEPGGRVASSRSPPAKPGYTAAPGYTLDRGFAVFIDSYPSLSAPGLLDLPALDLRPFQPGSLVLTSPGKLSRVADPLRRPLDLLPALLAPVGSLADKVKVLPLLLRVFTSSPAELFAEPETSTLAALSDRYGFSPAFVASFFRPFLQGIFLAPLEEQSSRMFHFVFKMFSEGAATLPRGGMGAAAKQLRGRAEALGAEIECGSRAVGIGRDGDGYRVSVERGGELRELLARRVIVAAAAPQARELLFGGKPPLLKATPTPPQPQREVGCVYYSLPEAQLPVADPILILNGLGAGDPRLSPVNNLCFPSAVAPGYAPPGRHLCSATVLGPALDAFREKGGLDERALGEAVREQLARDFFPARRREIEGWELLAVQRVPDAQPSQLGGASPASSWEPRVGEIGGVGLPPGAFVCGDHTATATLDGAIGSGLKAADAVLEELGKS